MIGPSGEANSISRFRFKGVLIICDPTSPDHPMTRSPDSLVSHNLQAGSRGYDSYDSLLIVHVNKHVAVVGTEPEAVAFQVLAFERDLLLALEVDGHNLGRVLSRYQYTKLLRSRVTAQSFRLRRTTKGQISPYQDLAMHKEVIVKNWRRMRHQVGNVI